MQFGVGLDAVLAAELDALNDVYKGHHARYGSLQDIFIAPGSIEHDRVMRKMYAVIRLARCYLS